MSLDFKSIEEAEEFADEIVADVTEGLRQALKPYRDRIDCPLLTQSGHALPKRTVFC